MRKAVRELKSRRVEECELKSRRVEKSKSLGAVFSTFKLFNFSTWSFLTWSFLTCSSILALSLPATALAQAKIGGKPTMGGSAVLGGGTPGNAQAAIAFVAAASGDDITGTTYASISTSSGLNVAIGNLLFVGVESNSSATTATVSDTAGNTFTQIGGNLTQGNGLYWMFFSRATAASSSDVFKASFSANQAYIGIVAMQFTGAHTAGPDKTAVYTQAAGSSQTITSPSFTPSTPGEVSCVFVGVYPVADTFTAGTNYTIPTGSTSGGVIAAEYYLNIGTASQTASMSDSASNYDLQAIMVATFAP